MPIFRVYFWITNKRIVVRTGLVGMEEKSILLERLGEVTIIQTWLQKLFGIYILQLEVIGDQTSETLPGIPRAEDIKQSLLKLIAEKRKAEKLTF